MSILRILVHLALFNDPGAGIAVETVPADAMMPEHIRIIVNQLDDPSFQRREQAVDQLFAMGIGAIYPLRLAVETGSPEVVVRAFDILLHLYRRDDEPTYEAVEQVFRELKHVENLAVTARAERALDNSITEVRQSRAIAKLERLGAIIHFSDRNRERQMGARPRINHVMIGRPDWVGVDQDLRLIARIEDLRMEVATLYIIRGTEISDATLLDLKAELPFLNIEPRGPARLGVTNSSDGACVIGDIEPGSSAERAGLKIGDKVLEIDGQKVNTFMELVEVIGKKEPGDRVPIVLRRDFETHEVVAELSSWSKKAASNVPQPKSEPQPSSVPQPKNIPQSKNAPQPKSESRP